MHDADKEAKRVRQVIEEGKKISERTTSATATATLTATATHTTTHTTTPKTASSLHNNNGKQQQIACPSALDATQYTHSYLLCQVKR